MNRRDWEILLICLIGGTVLDFAFKALAPFLVNSVGNLGPLTFSLVYNPGIILGQLNTLPPLIRIVGISTLYGLLFFLFFLINFYLATRAYIFKTGLALLFAGITGNTIDRVFYGQVLDFLSMPALSPTACNLADIIQWVGLTFCLVGLFKEEHSIWYPKELRNKFLINKKYQFRYAAFLVFLLICFSLVMGIFSFTFYKMLITMPADTQQNYLIHFLWIYAALSLLFCFFVFILGLYLSHRSAGPIYALTKYFDDLENGEERSFKLRQTDHFKELENLAHKVGENLKKRKEKETKQDS